MTPQQQKGNSEGPEGSKSNQGLMKSNQVNEIGLFIKQKGKRSG
jgi:hypothetical protein